MKITSAIAFCVFIVAPSVASAASAEQKAWMLLRRVAYTHEAKNSTLYNAVLAKIKAGDYGGASDLVTAEDGFTNYFVKNTLGSLSDLNGNFTTLNDSTALIMATVAMKRHMGTIFTTDQSAEFDPNVVNVAALPAFAANNRQARWVRAEQLDINFAKGLTTEAQSVKNGFMGFGIFSTDKFGKDCFFMGTNRRCFDKMILWRLMGISMDQVRDNNRSDAEVGRDVTHSPGGNPNAYLTNCKGCHSLFDKERLLFKFNDYNTNTGVTEITTIPNKYNRNATEYPEGYVVTPTSMASFPGPNDIAYKVMGINPIDGINPASLDRGSGLRLFANATAYWTNLYKVTFRAICGSEPTTTDLRNAASGLDSIRTGSGLYQDIVKGVITQCVAE